MRRRTTTRIHVVQHLKTFIAEESKNIGGSEMRKRGRRGAKKRSQVLSQQRSQKSWRNDQPTAAGAQVAFRNHYKKPKKILKKLNSIRTLTSQKVTSAKLPIF
jgi:hypothetical protein